jgi:N-acetyl-anhydromuramyl-L-alanine amidase AmpD
MSMKKELKPLSHEDVRFLVVHCSGNRCNQPLSVDGLTNTGYERFGQPSYHYYVRRNGSIIPILSESVRGVHAVGYNHCSIAICYEGGLDEHDVATDTRTELQKHALYELLKQLHEEYPLARIVGHHDLPGANKPCPCYSMEEYKGLQPK